MKTIYYLTLMISVIILVSCSGTKKVSQDLPENTKPATVIVEKADDNTESVIEAATAMYQAIANQDAETILNYMNPKVFEITPRDMMKEQMQRGMNNQSTENQSTEFLDIKEKSEPYVHEGIEYRLISSSMRAGMQLSVPEEGEDPDMMDQLSNSPDHMVPMLKERFGEDAVEFDEDKNIVYISNEMQMYASNDPANSGWKFMVTKDPMSKKVIPEAVLNQFK